MRFDRAPIRRFRSSQPYRDWLTEINKSPSFKAMMEAIRDGIGTPTRDPETIVGMHPDQSVAREFAYQRGVNDTLKLISEVMMFELEKAPSETDPDDLPEYEESLPKELQVKHRPQNPLKKPAAA